MPITVVSKLKPDTAPAVQATQSQQQILDELSVMVDAMAVLQQEKTAAETLAQLKGRDLREMEDEFQKLMNSEYDPDTVLAVKGSLYRAVVGRQSLVRSYVKDANKTLRRYLNKVKRGLFDELAVVRLTDLNKYLTPLQTADVLETSRGRRKIKYEKLE